jgi:shikimate 5-dehydrogenase
VDGIGTTQAIAKKDHFGYATGPRRGAGGMAEAAAWLLSDRASFVTGVVVPVTCDAAV